MEFNRNMGCIEILPFAITPPFLSAFNRNMGCIEMTCTFTF